MAQERAFVYVEPRQRLGSCGSVLSSFPLVCLRRSPPPNKAERTNKTSKTRLTTTNNNNPKRMKQPLRRSPPCTCNFILPPCNCMLLLLLLLSSLLPRFSCTKESTLHLVLRLRGGVAGLASLVDSCDPFGDQP